MSRTALGSAYALLGLTLGLYDLLGELVHVSKVPQRDEIVAGIVFLHGSRYALAKGTMELMRGHVMDSLSWIRSAAEYAGFADLVRREPAMARVWLEAAMSVEAYRTYKEAFKTRELFPREDPLMARLYQSYDMASQRIHASAHSFATKLRVISEVGATQIRYEYFDVRDATDIARTFLGMVAVHLEVIRAFQRLFAAAIQHEPGRWRQQFGAVERAFVSERTRWAPLLDPRLRPGGPSPRAP